MVMMFYCICKPDVPQTSFPAICSAQPVPVGSITDKESSAAGSYIQCDALLKLHVYNYRNPESNGTRSHNQY